MNEDDSLETAMIALIIALIAMGFWVMVLATYQTLKNEGANVYKVELAIPTAKKK